MHRVRSWGVGGLLVLEACGARSTLESSTADESSARHFGGAPGIGGALAIGGALTAMGGALANPVRVTTISAGMAHTCGISAAGAVKCWGYNEHGELGNGSTRTSSVPINVIGLSSGVLAVSVGVDACALTSAGGVKCWGANGFGQLGNGSRSSAVPLDVEGVSSGIVSISLGSVACALRSIGTVRCWGYDSYGEVGNGRSPIPADVVGLSGVVSVSAGDAHACAVTSSGAVKCWGRNDVGQLGNRSRGNSAVPADVVGLSSGVVSVSAGGAHTCAVTSTGAVKCWGSNNSGQLGNNSTADSRVPVDVVDLAGVVSVSAGGVLTCSINSTGAVKCWGSSHWDQSRFQSTSHTSLVPVAVVGLSSGVISVSVGGSHACAITSTGAVKCWGINDFGQLGNDSTTGSPVPVDVLGF
ncbi:MAG TPA: hypothetical protein VJV79_38165 [Polyangiaceae bacterium]|nr:hypothetical protein [Polyangiaceae bacterium]